MNFLKVLVEMWGVYTSSALPFLLIHAFVLLTVIWLSADIRKEIRALDACPGKEADGECARTLEQFVRECRLWGQRGIFVPVTDFSDRLDSHVTGYIESLHSRVNLFLVVGVAGTFFAMFQFAFKVSGTGADVARGLREGLVLAFPVGFFGLVWTLLGHYAAFALEQRLRRTVNGAIQRVMGQREAYSHGLLDEISDALKPLKDLQGTLGETLQPVLESLRGELKNMSALMVKQVKPLEAAIDEFRASAGSLTEPVRLLAEAAHEIPGVLSGVAEIQTQARLDLQAMPVAFQEARNELAAFSRASETLVETCDRISGASREIASKFDEKTGLLAERCLKTWEEQGGRFARDAAGSFAALCSDIQAASREAKNALAGAAGDLNRVSSQVASILEDSLSQLFEKAVAEVKPQLHSLNETLGARYPGMLESLKTAADRGESLAGRVEAINRELDATAERVREAAHRWEDMARELERIRMRPPYDLTAGIGQVKDEVQKTRDYLSKRFGRKPLETLWDRFRRSNWSRE